MYARSLALVATLLLASQANANPRNTAKAHVDAAMKAHKEGKFDVALDELKAAYALDPKPDLLFAIAQVYVKLDKCPDAITYYEKFLATTKDPQAKQVVTQAIEACKQKAAPPPPPKDDPPPPPPKDDTPPPPPKDDTPPPPPPKDDNPLPHKDNSPFNAGRSDTGGKKAFYKDVLGDVLVVGGVGSGVVGLVFYSGAKSKADATAATSSEFIDNQDKAKSQRTLAVVFGVGGAAVATVGVVHWMMFRGKQKESASRVVVVPTTEGGFVTWNGRF